MFGVIQLCPWACDRLTNLMQGFHLFPSDHVSNYSDNMPKCDAVLVLSCMLARKPPPPAALLMPPTAEIRAGPPEPSLKTHGFHEPEHCLWHPLIRLIRKFEQIERKGAAEYGGLTDSNLKSQRDCLSSSFPLRNGAAPLSV